MKWSERQLEAIKAKDKDILVSASAGSGKTAVLSERIIDIIVNERVDIDKFIVVTFTKLAANEMRQRIVKNIEKLKNEIEDKELLNFLEKQTILAQKANISTLHSFGFSLVKDYFYLLNLSPDVSMIEDVEAKMIKSDVMDEILNEYYEKDNETVRILSRMYSNFKSDDGLIALINEFSSFALNMVNPYKAIDEAVSLYIDEHTDRKDELYKIFKEEATMILGDLRKNLVEYAQDFEAIQGDIEVLDKIKNAINSSYEELQVYLTNIKFATLRFPKEYDEIEKEKIKEKRKMLKDYVASLAKTYFKNSKEQLAYMIESMREPIKVLANITKEYIKRYDDIKRSMNKIDFNDIEHLTLNLLIDNAGNITEICKEIRETYRYVIVDEYQDINEVQETILKSISCYKSQTPNMFMVGDIKQSIYKFRKADPEIFAGKYNRFSKDKEAKEYKIDLNQNFRSRKEVLDSINAIFEKVMKKQFGDIEYDEEMKLVYGNLYKEDMKQEYVTEQYVIVEQKKNNEECANEEDCDSEENSIEEISRYEKEAVLIANKINEYMNSKFQVYDIKKEAYRDVKYSDFVILLRSMGQDSYTIYNKLCMLGTPVTFGKEENFMTQMQVRKLINILKIIDNPHDDIPLVSTLYSRMFNLTCEELYKISKNREKNVTLFQQLESYSLDDKIKEKIENFMNYYLKWRELSKDDTLLNLIKTIIDDLDLMYDISYIKDANLVKESVNQLVKLISKYQDGANASVSDLVEYLNFIIDNGIEIIIESEKETSNSVSMMTIHKSKGLEYPIVFLPMLGKKFNQADVRKKVILDKKYGLISSYVNFEKYYMTSNFYKEVVIDKISKESLAEEMRVLYVAMTRAKEKLIMIGTTNNQVVLDGYIPDSSYLSIKKSKSYLDLVQHAIFNLPKYIHTTVLTESTYDGEERKILELKDLKIGNEDTKNLFEYPYKEVTDKNEKVSVTELKHLEMQKHGKEKNESNSYGNNTKLDFSITDKLSPTEKGTMIHKIMKMIDGTKTLKECFAEYINHKIFSEEELKQVDKEKVEMYLNSEIFRRINNAKVVKKEMPFMMRKKVSEVYRDANKDDYVIIQGIIDCMFEENDGIVILDYKTDKVKYSNDEEKTLRIEEIKNDYKKQLDLYEEAIEKLTGKKVKEKILYLFDIGEIAYL